MRRFAMQSKAMHENQAGCAVACLAPTQQSCHEAEPTASIPRMAVSGRTGASSSWWRACARAALATRRVYRSRISL